RDARRAQREADHGREGSRRVRPRLPRGHLRHVRHDDQRPPPRADEGHDDMIVIETFRAKAFPVLKDLVVDRSSFDRIIQAGGFISANAGSTPEANSMLVAKSVSDEAMNAA